MSARKSPALRSLEGSVVVFFEKRVNEVELKSAEVLLKSPAMMTGFLMSLM